MISFVGSGPGAPDLLTIRAKDRIENADIVIWASSLVPEEILSFMKTGAGLYDSKTMTLEDVISIYKANSDKNIVRLHSGDPSIYGAIGEQIDWCIDNGIDFEIVPGVSSFSAAAATIKKELTLPSLSQTVILTRLGARTISSMNKNEDISQLSQFGSTMAVFLSAARPSQLKEALLKSPSKYQKDTPACVIYRVGWPDEKIINTTVENIPGAIKQIGAKRTILVIVGQVLNDKGSRTHLYNPNFAHRFRKMASDLPIESA
jgi:precorrin-4/cobalt-precorrin-4 C11-methyltransferase